jgi:hypothetical protein
MGEKKKGFLWSAVGTGSLLWSLSSYENYNSKSKSYENAQEAYAHTETDFEYYKSVLEAESTNKNGALTQLIISSTVYTSVVLINYLSFRSKKDSYSHSNKINGSINDLGQLTIIFPL